MDKVFVIIAFLSNYMIGQTQDIWKENCLTNDEHENRYASYSPDGKWIAYESDRGGSWNIYLMDSNGQNLEKLTGDKSDDRRPSWHPNGKKLLFESNSDGINELFTIELNDRKVTKLKNQLNQGEVIFASFSPNGKKIAVSIQESDDKSDIVILKKNGEIHKTLVTNGKRNFYPKWSPNGKEILYFSRKDTRNKDDEIYRIDLETGEDVRLTNWSKHNFCPSWSFDNSKIVYVTSMESTRPEIYIMDRDGKNQTRITENENGDTLPNWHPNTDKLLITAYRNGSYQVCELELIRG